VNWGDVTSLSFAMVATSFIAIPADKIYSGYNLREITDHIDELRFRSQAGKHELSPLYEARIKNMGNAGRNGGEYYKKRS